MVFRITWANIPNRQITIPHKLMKVISLPLIITAKVKMVTSLKTPIMAKVSEEAQVTTRNSATSIQKAIRPPVKQNYIYVCIS